MKIPLFLLQLQNIVTYDKKSFCKGHVIRRDKCLELNFTTSQFLNKLFEYLFEYKNMKTPIQNKCLSFKTRLFNLTFQVSGANSKTICMATDLSFRFTCKLLHILDSFILSKSILIICSQVIHTYFETLNFPTLTATRIFIL